MVRDPFGFRWSLCTHLEELTAEEIGRRMQTWNPETGTW
jgi:hypothetical protein